MLTEDIRDECRKGLLKYLRRALSAIPALKKPLILDLGCGTGVPTIELAARYDGVIYAVDPDKDAITRLNHKINKLNLAGRIITLTDSASTFHSPDIKFDLIIAEGLLNVIGFRTGLKIFERHIKTPGYVVIHDEQKDPEKKLKMFGESGYSMLDTFSLNEDVWWNDYYACLEKNILSLDDEEKRKHFAGDVKEMEMYRQDPVQFRSAYYILQKRGV